MIVGGPPCQGFSGLNRFQERTKGEETINALVVTYLSFIDHFKPRFAVMENVKGLLSTAKGNVCALILSTLIAIGYQVRLGILNAGQFGLPQSRVRLIVMASKVGDVLPEFPVPTHTFIIQGARFREIPVALGRSGAQSAPGVLTTTRMALSDLPEIEYGATKTNGLSYATEPPSDFARELRGKETEVTNHITRGLDELNFTRISSIPREKPGVDWRSLPDHLIPWCLPNTADRHNDWRGLYGRLDWDGTITEYSLSAVQ
jgi:DNA (cytosine-5)-methyltransferase 1